MDAATPVSGASGWSVVLCGHLFAPGRVGYSIGNAGASNGNHFFYTAVGVNFN